MYMPKDQTLPRQGSGLGSETTARVDSKEELSVTAAVDSTIANGRQTVTAFHGVWQAKVGVIHQPETASQHRIKPSDPVSASTTAHTGLNDSAATVYHIDLESAKEISDSTTVKIKATRPSLWQPLSPWKRRNKVAPSPHLVHSSVSKTAMATPLQSDTRLLTAGKENTYPLKLLATDLRSDFDALEINAPPAGFSTPIGCQESLANPQYSTVKKKKKKKNKRQTDSPPPLPPRQDGGVRYSEACSPSSVDDEIIIGVLSSHQSPPAAHTAADDIDSLYDSLQDYTEENYAEIIDSAHHRETEKQGTGTVQLLSIRGQKPLTMETQFEGIIIDAGSTEMHPIHYVAAKGDKKELAGVLASLPIIQDPVERVLGSSKFQLREGVNVRDGEGRTALMHAVHHEHFDCVQLLANAGANVNLEAADGSTCLHDAAYSGSLKMIALLLSLGADGLKKDNEGRVPLHWCTHNYKSDCIKLLLDKVPGLSANIADGTHMTPLMWAGYHGQVENIEILKQKGGDAKLVDCDGMRAIHWSVKSHDLRTLKALLDADSAQYQDLKGRTIMHYAAETGFAKAVPVIKEAQPLSISDKDHNGRTPLHWATVCEKPDVIRALLTAGADPDVQDIHSLSALDYALQKRLSYCALLLTQGSQQQFQESSSYNHVLTLGESTGIGVRTLMQQVPGLSANQTRLT